MSFWLRLFYVHHKDFHVHDEYRVFINIEVPSRRLRARARRADCAL